MYRERERVWVNETNIDHVIWKIIKKQQKLKKNPGEDFPYYAVTLGF